MNKYTITKFPSLYKAKDYTQHVVSWKQLNIALTRDRAPKPKKQQILWSPCTFNGEARSIANAIELSCLVFDIDGGQRFSDVAAFMQRFEIKHIMHTTASSTKKHNKFRVVLPLLKPAPAQDWYYYYVAGLNWWKSCFDTEADPACKDASRMFFIGGYGEHKMHSFSDEGRVYNWEESARREQVKAQERFERKREEAKKRTTQRELHTKHLDKKHHSHSDATQYTKDMLYICSNTRRALAEKIGARPNTSTKNPEHAGTRAVGFACPYCKRSDLTFFYYDPTRSAGAYCGHAKSCGDGFRPRYMKIEFLAEYYWFI